MTKNNNEFTHKDGVTLKEYLEARLDAIDKATEIANSRMNERLAGMNEFRTALSDQSNTFITRKEFEAKWEGMEKSRKDNTSLAIAMIGIVISVVSLLIKFV